MARARLLVKADLSWVGGYPSGGAGANGTGVPWCVPPSEGRPARTTNVDRAVLHRATRALAELDAHFRDVQGELFDDARAWRDGARAAIDALKPAVHGTPGAADPSSLLLASGVHRAPVVASIRAAPAALRAVLHAAAWAFVGAPERLASAAALVLEHRAAFVALRAALEPAKAEAVAAHLALLAGEEGAARVAPLARLLAVPALYAAPTAGSEYARALANKPRGERAPRPKATLGPALAAWTERLLLAPPRARRRALALLASLELAAAAEEWAAWWARVDRCERLARAEPESKDDARVRAKATRIADGAPRVLRGESLASVLAGVLAWDEKTHAEAARALSELPAFAGGVPVRLAFVEHWVTLGEDAKPGRAAAVVAGFARYLQRTRACGERRMHPWAKLLDRRSHGYRWATPAASLMDEVAPARWPAFFEALARAVEDGDADPARLATALVDVLPLESDAAHALALARALAPHHGRLRSGDGLRVAHALFGADAASFGQAAAALARADADTERQFLVRGLEAVRAGGGDDLARGLLLDEPDSLVACGRKLAVLSLAGGARDLATLRASAATPASDGAWVSEYPAWVAPALRRLADADVHAERLARRILGDEVRATAIIRRELAHLESLAERGAGGDRVRRRIANLRVRLEAPRPVVPSVRAHLLTKVERAARRARLARLDAALEGALRARLPSLVGADPPPAWLFDPRTLEQLAPVASFEPPMRALALRVLRLRAGPPPWDLRDEPPNRAFLERLRRAGADTTPWVEGVGTVRVTTAQGKQVDLRLEDDPLEILDMGKHFATCLSPGGVNYFSAFANVADVNKRVLYARDAAGKVAGRCLLALTQTGALVAFHRYAHDASLGFEAMVAGFARDLAARMRVLVVAHGEVPRLVAPDWYDDGTLDLGERFPFLQEGSPLRASLPALAPDVFAAEAARLFAPLPLGALTLPLLVALPEMDARPELLVGLLPAIVASEGLPLPTVARVVALLARTPEAGTAARALVPRIVAGLRRAGEDEELGWLEGAVASVVEACPSDALRLLRATRARRVRSWADEHDPRRLEMAARAFEALRRPRLAAQTYRLAASRAYTVTARKDFEQKAAALEAALAQRR